jgi:phosphoglycolate phosphatase
MKNIAHDNISLTGSVCAGFGQGAGFTSLDWVRGQFLNACGIDPYPGTLNLRLSEPAQLSRWARVKQGTGATVVPGEDDACDASLYPVTISAAGATVPAAVIVPHVDDYAGDRIEIVASMGLRDHFALVDGDTLQLTFQQPHALRAAIFDVDGTLLNSLDGYHLAASRATARYGYEVTLEHVRRALNTNQPFWDFVIPDGEPRDEKRILELRDETMRHWPDALAEVVDVLPGVAPALERLRSDGVRLAIYTGSAGESLPPLRDAGLLEYFEAVVTSNDVERRKPDPQGIEHCLQLLGMPAAQAAYIGDSRIDVDASLAAGVTSFAVLTGAGDAASLAAAGAHRVVAHVGGVPDLLVRPGPG